MSLVMQYDDQSDQHIRFTGFMNFMSSGEFFSAFSYALRHGLPKELMERALIFGYGKVNRGRSEFFRQRVLAALFADIDASRRADPLALYSIAMEREQFFLAALLLQEDIVGIEQEVIDTLTKSAVQAAFLQASATFDRPLMDRLVETFPDLFDNDAC